MEPLLIVYGWDFFCRRIVQQIAETKRGEGWRVTSVAGSDHETLQGLTSMSDLLVSAPHVLAIVTDPEDAPLPLLEAHAEERDPVTVLLLHIDGEPDGRRKFGQWVKKQPKTRALFFGTPKPWDLPKEAARFAVAEAAGTPFDSPDCGIKGFKTRPHGKKLDMALANALVERAGSDFGVVAFEIEKAVTLANIQGSDTITPEILKATMASLLPVNIGPLIDALAARKKAALAKALARVRQTHKKEDPTMHVCRFLGESVVKWMQAAYLDALPVNEAAREVGINPWRYENIILPAARRWGREGTVRLVSDLAASERAVLNGAVSPWNVLSARLLAACG